MSTSIEGLVAPIETTSGVYLDAANPKPEHVPGPYDLGYALCRLNRFGGHGTTLCSVAMHSLMVACLLGRDPDAPDDLILAGLLHDAAECFVGDVPSPVKRLIGGRYAEIERAVAHAIAEAYGLDPSLFDHPLLAQADADALAIEAHKNLPSKGVGWGLRDPQEIRFTNGEPANILKNMGADPVALRHGPDGGGPEMGDYAQSWAEAVMHLAPTHPENTVGPQCPETTKVDICTYHCLGVIGHTGEHRYSFDRDAEIGQQEGGPDVG